MKNFVILIISILILFGCSPSTKVLEKNISVDEIKGEKFQLEARDIVSIGE